jgi:Fur family transcriptional regulator, stress-responsive regulator
MNPTSSGATGAPATRLVCRRCGRTEPTSAAGPAPALPLPAATGAAGFRVEAAEVVFWGHCPACRTHP